MNTRTRLALMAVGAGTALTILVAPAAMAVPPTADAAAGAKTTASSGQPLQWVRGTHVTITNNTGQDIKIGTEAATWDRVPRLQLSTLKSGGSVTESEAWRSATGTSVLAQVEFQDGKGVQFSAENPGIGEPCANFRDSKWGTLDWQNAPFDSHSFDEGESWTANCDNGHSVTFKRMSDDSSGHGDSKVWNITINK